MDIKELSLINEDVSRHWYYKSKANAMCALLENEYPEAVLDVGAGSAFFSKYLLEHTRIERSICVDISYQFDGNSHHAGGEIIYRRFVNNVDVGLVLMMDVLEHINDDISFLKMYVDKVPKGTKFLISVPAFQFLWSGHDEFLEHKRRYNISQLERVVINAGLKIEKSTYYFAFIFPLVAIMRISAKYLKSQTKSKKSQLTNHNWLVNKLLSWICRAELILLGFNRCAGLTVFCLCVK